MLNNEDEDVSFGDDNDVIENVEIREGRLIADARLNDVEERRITHEIVIPGDLKTLGYEAAYNEMIAVPIPERTDTYTPLAHQAVDEYIKQVVGEMGIQLVDQEYKVSNNGQVAMGLYTLDRQAVEKDIQFRIAWRNSYDKTRKFSLATGLRIMACGNGAFWGDSGNLSRSHRGDLDYDFRRVVENEILRMDNKLSQGLELNHKWGNERLTRKQWGAMFGEIVMDTKLITPTMLTPLREDLKRGPFRVQADGHHTRWGMYMNITHALKSVSPGNYINQQRLAHDTMDLMKAPSFAL